jgi:pimeloyl-ACP methyl ester carboxylesterase
MVMSDLAVAGGNFRVRLWDGGRGDPLLFLHGYDGHPGEAPFLEELAKGRRVIAPEHPGFGDSTGIEHIDDILDMTLYYRQFIEALGLDRVDLMGHSLGGMFAAELAAICPQVVKRLVLVSPFGLWLEDAQIPDLFIMSPPQLQRATWHDSESNVAQQALSAQANGKSGTAAIVNRAGNLSTAGKFLWPIPDRGLAKRLGLIKAPTQVIVGESDKLIGKAYGEAFAARIGGAKLAVIPEAGHLPMYEQPEAFGQVIEGFLRS